MDAASIARDLEFARLAMPFAPPGEVIAANPAALFQTAAGGPRFDASANYAAHLGAQLAGMAAPVGDVTTPR